jgi:Uma2 family endonuclease
MSTQPRTLLTPEQYLEIERKAEYKSEYLNGEMFAMSGASRAHNLLATNVTAILRPQLRNRGCEIYASDMRVHIPATGLYTYPDIVVACGQPQFLDGNVDTLLNPTFLAEVLSPSTEAYDLGRKFEYYRKLESLSQYLVVAQDRLNANLYTKRDGDWFLRGFNSMEDTLDLHSIGCKLTLADVYEDVTLPPPQLTGELRP